MARLRRDLSRREVAERAGVSMNTIVSIEKGMPTVSIGAIANVLHSLNLAEDLILLAKDDKLGRKLQDLALEPTARASRKKLRNE